MPYACPFDVLRLPPQAECAAAWPNHTRAPNQFTHHTGSADAEASGSGSPFADGSFREATRPDASESSSSLRPKASQKMVAQAAIANITMGAIMYWSGGGRRYGLPLAR